MGLPHSAHDISDWHMTRYTATPFITCRLRAIWPILGAAWLGWDVALGQKVAHFADVAGFGASGGHAAEIRVSCHAKAALSAGGWQHFGRFARCAGGGGGCHACGHGAGAAAGAAGAVFGLGAAGRWRRYWPRGCGHGAGAGQVSRARAACRTGPPPRRRADAAPRPAVGCNGATPM